MKNFILFVVVASCLAFAGYFGYRVYYVGDAPREVWNDMTGGGASGPSYLERAERAWQDKRWRDAAENYANAKAAYLADDPDNKLYTEEDVEHVYLRVGMSWAKVYEASGKTDQEAKEKAKAALQAYLDDERWEKSYDRSVASRQLRDLE
jgi:hypothetical protein